MSELQVLLNVANNIPTHNIDSLSMLVNYLENDLFTFGGFIENYEKNGGIIEFCDIRALEDQHKNDVLFEFLNTFSCNQELAPVVGTNYEVKLTDVCAKLNNNYNLVYGLFAYIVLDVMGYRFI